MANFAQWRIRVHRYVRFPYWFRYYIRDNKEWKYTVVNEQETYYCNKCELDYNQRRRYKGYYTFEISDKELLNIERHLYVKKYR